MGKHDQLINGFKSFAQSAISRHMPSAYKSYQKGTITRIQTFLKEYSKKLQSYSTEVTNEANRILSNADEKELDMSKLKNDLSAECKTYISKFMSDANALK